MPTSVKDIITRNDELNSQNANWRGYWQDIADYCLPRKAWVDSIRTKGERVKFNFLYDSTAIKSLRIMAAGFHSNLTNPSTRWFALSTKNQRLMERREVQLYFKDVEDEMYSALNGSNFYNTIQEFYTNYGCFGTAAFSELEDNKETVRFKEIPTGRYNIEEDANGRITNFYWTFPLTASQAVKLWGDNSGKTALELVKKKPLEKLDFMHFVGPRPDRNVSKSDSVNMPFKSVWISVKDKHMIGEGGFMEHPYLVGRFYKDHTDVFGFSPAMDTLADIRLINAMKKTIIRAGMKQADPPMMMPSRGFVLPLNFNPGAMNYREAKSTKDDIQPLPVTSGNLPITIDILKLEKESIEEGFFVPLFRSLAEITKQMTIPEVQRRVAENMVLLGPVVGRTTYEVLDPALIRLYFILERNGRLPLPPDILQDQEFSPVYLSPLAKAQREADITQIERFLGDVQAIATVKPSVLDKINEDRTVEIIAKMKGIDPEILNSQEEADGIRAARAEQESLAAAAQLAESAGATSRDMAQASKAQAEAGGLK